MFAIQIQAVDKFAPAVDPLRLNCLQAGVCAVGSAIISIFTEDTSLSGVLVCWFPLCYAGFLSMGAAYSLQIIGQKHADPNVSSLILSLESVFAVIGAAMVLGERMSGREYLGCAIVLLAVLIAQLEPEFVAKFIKIGDKSKQ